MLDAPASDAAPGRLRIVQDLANSYDAARGRDDLADEAAAADWLSRRGVRRSDDPLTNQELAALRRLRAAIRRLCLANSGCERHPQDLRLVADMARRAGVHPVFDPDGQVTLRVDAPGGLGGGGQLVAIVFEAAWGGVWQRLKACPGDACHYAFYDHTRNNSRTWCAMARCGSRAKMRTYRARRQGS